MLKRDVEQARVQEAAVTSRQYSLADVDRGPIRARSRRDPAAAVDP